MKSNYIIVAMLLSIVFMSICLLYANQIIQPAGLFVTQNRNTDGTMTFTIKTITYGGTYAPENAGVIWITNSSNQFVKTIKIWAQTYRNKLVKWVASSGYNTTGAITGASLTNHQIHTVTWNGQNSADSPVPDGNYTVNIEFTEHNSTANFPGKYKTIVLAKGPNAIDETYPNETYFSNIHLAWVPVVPVNGIISGTVSDNQTNPIPNAVISTSGDNTTTDANGHYSLSLQPGEYNLSCQAPSFSTLNQNNVTVISNQTTTINFTMSQVDNIDPINNAHPNIQLQNYPNPFKSTTTIKFITDFKSENEISIYNAKGQLIRTLVDKTYDKGLHSVVWDGKNNSGHYAPTGKYLCRLQSNGKTFTRTITIQR